MNLTITPISLQAFTSKNKKKKPTKTNQQDNSLVQSNTQRKIILGQLPSTPIQKPRDFKNPAYTHPQITWNYSNKPKEKIINETIKKYNLKIKPKTLEYVFDSKSLDDDKFQKYETLGLHAYNLYLKSLLFRHFPYKSENDLTKIQSAASKNQEAAILATLFNGSLFNNVGLVAKKPHARYFHALLGAIIDEGGKFGHKNLNDFLKKYAQSTIIKTMPTMPKNKLEIFYEDFKHFGYDPK